MIPVAEDDGDVAVVLVGLLRVVDDEGRAQAVDVLALQDNERGI